MPQTTALSVDLNDLSVTFVTANWFTRLNKIFHGQMI
jgi:hypothetical protein